MNLAAMTKRISSCAAFSLAAALLFSASLAHAGPLASDLAISYGGAWAGSTHFVSGTLEGDVEWAVYKAADFPYTGSGYTPTAGQLVYAYQVYVTGSAPVSHFDVDVPNSANNIGAFTSIGTVSPSAMSLGIAPTLAAFDFHSPSIAMGSNSVGLAFSSEKVPQDWFGSVIDTGQSTFVVPIPAPSSITIPEPAAVTLVCLGAAILLPGVVRRRRNR